MVHPFRRRAATPAQPACATARPRVAPVTAEPLESRTMLSFELVQNFGGSSEPPVQGLVRLQDRIYFAAQHPTLSMFGVWSSDGTSAGTLSLANGDTATMWRRGGPVIAGDQVFFEGQIGINDYVWASRGTPETTTRLSVYGGGANNNTDTNTWGAALGNRVVFLGVAAIPGQPELYITDGTDAGTTPLSAALPAPHARANTVLGTHNGLTWFTDATTQGLARLGVTDGTAAGTRIIADLNTGVGLVRPEYFTPVGSQVFFQVPTAQGLRLWKSDGTAAGTAQVDAFERPVAAAMTELGGKLLYSAEGGLYRTDGTRAGTELVYQTGYSTSTGGTPHLFRANDVVWFMNGENWRRGDGRGGLWRTDGTAAGTVQVLPNAQVNGFFRFGDRVWLGGLRQVVDLSVDPLEPHATGLADPPWPYQPYYPPFTLAELGNYVYFPNAQGLYRTEIPTRYLANVSLRLFNDTDEDGTRDAGEGAYVSPAFDAYVDLNDSATPDVGEPRATVRADGTVLLMGVPDGHYVVRVSENQARFTTPQAIPIDVAGADVSVPVGVNRNVHVRGTVYDDHNADHQRQPGEPPIEGRAVYLDTDGDRVRDPEEPFTLTGPDGAYFFQNLLGNGVIRAELPPGWRETEQEGGRTYSLTIPMAFDFDFGAFGITTQPPTGSVSFQTFLDYDGDGVKHVYEPIALVRMLGFLDADGDGLPDPDEPAWSMFDGTFTFGYVLPGNYQAKVVPPPGWELESSPALTVTSGSVNNLPALALRPTGQAGSISGTVYVDDDFDGVRDLGEPSVRTNGTVVYLDLDGNGAWSFDPSTEPATVTDAAGRYHFPGLTPGAYRVGLTGTGRGESLLPVSPRLPAVQTVTFDGATPAEANFGVTTQDRAGRVTGRVYQDVNVNGTFDAGDVPIPNVVVYRDVTRNTRFDAGDYGALTGPDGSYVLPLGDGGSQLIAVAAPAAWSPVTPASANVTPVRFQTVSGPNFRLIPASPGAPLPAALLVNLFHDLDLDGIRDPVEPDGIPALSGTIGGKPAPYLDADRDGVHDATEPLGFFNDRGEALLGGLVPGNYSVRLATANGWSQTQPTLPAAREATLAAGDRASLVFGAAYAPAGASGDVYLDANANGVRDAGEGPAVGAHVTLDLDGNGFDAPDPMAVTDAQGRFFFGGLSSGVYRVAIGTDVNFRQTDPAGAAPQTVTLRPGESVAGLTFGAERVAGTMSGRVFYDNNRDGQMNGSDGPVPGTLVRVQDTANAAKSWSTTATQQGLWQIDGIPAGNYRVSATAQAEWESTVPGGAGTYTLALDRGQVVAGLDFGYHRKRVGFEGSVFNDATADGWDASDPPAGGLTVYLDRNGNGRLDDGDLTTVTDANGKFSFAGLEVDRDQWTFRLVRPSQAIAGPGALTVYTPAAGTTGDVGRFLYFRPTTRFITGTAYHDVNANGRRDPSEPPIVGRSIGYDYDRNGVLTGSDFFGTTDDEGWYAIGIGDPRDLYFVRDMLPPDWVGTSPPNGAWRVMTPNAAEWYPNVDFGSISWPDAGKAKVFGRDVIYDAPPAPAGSASAAAATPAPPGKRALLPGEAAGFDNVTAAARGIPGVSVDLAGLDPGAVLTADDFRLAVSDAPGAAQWSPVTPAAVTVHPGEGLGGSHRVLLTLPSAVRNAWLRVTVLAGGHSLLTTPEVFYFGNLVGDAGFNRGSPTVNATDLARTRGAAGKSDPASLAVYDFNRDGVINAADVLIVRSNQRHTLSLFTAPPVGSPAAAPRDFAVPSLSRAPSRPGRRSVLADGDAGVLA